MLGVFVLGSGFCSGRVAFGQFVCSVVLLFGLGVVRPVLFSAPGVVRFGVFSARCLSRPFFCFGWVCFGPGVCAAGVFVRVLSSSPASSRGSVACCSPYLVLDLNLVVDICGEERRQ